MPIVLVLFLTLLAPTSGPSSRPAAQSGQRVFVGCISQRPDGRLQFGTVPSGNLYLLQGQANQVEARVNQLVRVLGESARSGNQNSGLAILRVDRVQTMAGSCTSALPAKKVERVPGKVGEDMVDVPHGTTSAGDKTTPGFQTQAADQRVEAPAAPANPEQAGQSEAAADVDAGSVERTEILPGKTLGVNGAGVPAATAPNGAAPAAGSPAFSPNSPNAANRGETASGSGE